MSDGSIGKSPHTGRFQKGNPGGPGNPWSKRIAQLRKAFYAKVTTEDIEEVTDNLLRLAKGNDGFQAVQAAKILFAYMLGAPQTTYGEEDENTRERLSKLTLPELMDMVKKALPEMETNVITVESKTIDEKNNNCIERGLPSGEQNVERNQG